MLGIIGYGRMGSAIAKNALKYYRKIFVRDLKRLRNLPKGVKQVNLYDLLTNSEIVLLAVKPQDMKDLLFDIDEILGYAERKKKLFITIAAGLPIKFYENLLGKDIAIVRVMPNICVKVDYSSGAYITNKNVKKKHLKIIENLFGKNLIRIRDERLIDVVTAIAASAPAFISAMMKNFVDIGKRYGLKEKDARKLVINTFLGTSLLLKKEGISFDELIRSVASPKGTTEAGLEIWRKNKLDLLIKKVLKKTIERSRKLSSKL
ncbi:MAG: hypothetical protein DRO04_00305 [Candidatus Iainarchaeum archaeon]|uniref:Pyrroline-5-carboxylate reductase n=1 Tax=Candidatus Iainarchaeum sp. TaxID=3101447 RepID=A0A497JJK4_9ARCH|nr:MAG: hypothetical protein DRO04_00305 [Candidatus Diapherotrites archaeon]